MKQLTAAMLHARGHLRPSDLFLALVSYVPLMVTHRGNLGADTKAYLYLNPGGLLERASSLWDPAIGLGTVTHQNIGYLFPMGPYYWAAEQLGIPDWLAQRFWMGSILFASAMGVRYLLATLKWERHGTAVAALCYALSPYLLHYIYKHSVLLLPFAALPWLIATMVRALRHTGWKYPAHFALIVQLVGGINATSLILVLIGPALWILHSVFVEKELTIKEVWAPIGKISLLTIITSLWWASGLVLQGNYGLNVLYFTETYKTVADASSSLEIGRGLGYWFMYGIDTLGPWFEAGTTYTENLPALALSFVLPIVCLACGYSVRFRHRGFFVTSALVAFVVAVGAHPFDSPSLYGRLFKAFTETDAGLALRSTPRALPMVILTLAVFLGAAVAACAEKVPKAQWLSSIGAMTLVIANLSPLWTGDMIDAFLERPNDVPAYWHQAADYLDKGDSSTRVFEAPGIDFANYRWGASVDPITPGLTSRDYVARELFPYGTAPSADMLIALDNAMQTGSLEPQALAPMLQLLNTGDFVLRNDLQYERFRTARPDQLFNFARHAPGLDTPKTFGPRIANRAPATKPLWDDYHYSTSYNLDTSPEVAVFPVDSPLAQLRAVTAERPTILSGNAEGFVTAAESSALYPKRLNMYSATLEQRGESAKELFDTDPRLVVTDTNRLAARRWGTIKDFEGYTMTLADRSINDPDDNRLALYNDQPLHTFSTAEHGTQLHVDASDYGNPLTLTPGDRAVLAVDGDPTTAWRVAAFGDARSEDLTISSVDQLPVVTDPDGVVNITQPDIGTNRHITNIDISAENGHSQHVALTNDSRGESGQAITIDPELSNARKLTFTIRATSNDSASSFQGVSGVGFTEINVGPARHATEWIRPPTDLNELLDAYSEQRIEDFDVNLLFRRKTAANDSIAPAPERQINRVVDLGTNMDFSTTGMARVHPSLRDEAIDDLLGADPRGATFSSSSRLTGDTTWRASKIRDGDLTSGWQSSLYPQVGSFVNMSLDSPQEVSFSDITLTVDGEHSLPRAFHFEFDGVPYGQVLVDPEPFSQQADNGAKFLAPDGHVTIDLGENGTSNGPVTNIRLVIDDITYATAPDWLNNLPVQLPLGIAELQGSPNVSPMLPDSTDEIPDDCRTGMLTVDEIDVPLRLSGSVSDAEAGRPLQAEQCNTGVSFGSNDTFIQTAIGTTTGFDIDRLAFHHVGTAANARESAAKSNAEPEADVAEVNVSRRDRTRITATLDTPTNPFWLVLGQSHNSGWELSVNGESLGSSELVNGFANGWLIDPSNIASTDGTLAVELVWTPQRVVDISIWVSLVGILVTCALALTTSRLRRTDESINTYPQWSNPLSVTGSRPPSAQSVATALAGFVVLGFTTTWFWAVVGAGVIALGLLWDRGLAALRGVSIGLIVTTAIYVVISQMHRDFPLDFDWPQHFDSAHFAHLLGWLLLGADAAVTALRKRSRR